MMKLDSCDARDGTKEVTVNEAFLEQNLQMVSYLPELILERFAKDLNCLELCHYSVKCIPQLAAFVNLTKLNIVAQDINRISNLESCKRLKELRIVECQIAKIENLDQCVNLEKLYLYGNAIKRIENLSQLSKLSTLWLSDNQIERVENLTGLRNLKDLCLANNRINWIGQSDLLELPLHTINLAGNRICTVRDVRHLAAIKTLRTLKLRDEDFADNPICSLSSYAFLVSSLLPQIIRLDDLQVNDEFRLALKAVLLQKSVFYHSKKQVVWRNANYLLNLADSCLSGEFKKATLHPGELQEELTSFYARFKTLLYNLATFLCASFDQALNTAGNVELTAVDGPPCGNPSPNEELPKGVQVESAYRVSNRAFAFIDTVRDETFEQPGQLCSILFPASSIERVLELFEYGVDAGSLPELLKASANVKEPAFKVTFKPVFENDFSRTPPKTVSLALHEPTPSEASKLQRSLGEIVRYCPTLLLKLENTPKDLGSALLSSLVADLSVGEKLALAELPQLCVIEALTKYAQSVVAKFSQRLKTDIPQVQPLLQDLATMQTDALVSLTLSGVKRPPSDWRIFACSCFPSLVELRLSHAAIDQADLSAAGNGSAFVSAERFPKLAYLDLSDNLLHSLCKVLSGGPRLQLEHLDVSRNQIANESSFDLPQLLQVRTLKRFYVTGNPYVNSNDVLHLLDLFQSRNRTRMSTFMGCNEESNAQHFKEVSRLCLRGIPLALDSVSTLTVNSQSLVMLDISGTYLTSLRALQPLVNLAVLVAENNRVNSLSGVETLKSLSELYVGNNRLRDLKTFLYLKPLANLLVFDYSGNPVSLGEPNLQRNFLVHQLQRATCGRFRILNGSPVQQGEIDRAHDYFNARLTKEQLFESIVVQESQRRVKSNSHNIISFYTMLEANPDHIFANLINLNLSNMKLRHLDALCGPEATSAFPKLVKINLDNNLLANLDGVAHLKELQVIYAKNNRISQLVSQGLQSGVGGSAIFSNLEELHLCGNQFVHLSFAMTRPLPKLRLLNLQKNSITKVEQLQHPAKQLSELNLSENSIKKWSVGSFSSACYPSLRVLHLNDNRVAAFEYQDSFAATLETVFLHNNKVCDMEQISALADTLRSCELSLKSLTLRGNPVSHRSAYRNTCIIKFARIKTLDDQSVSEQERKEVEAYMLLLQEQQQQLNLMSMSSISLLGKADITKPAIRKSTSSLKFVALSNSLPSLAPYGGGLSFSETKSFPKKFLSAERLSEPPGVKPKLSQLSLIQSIIKPARPTSSGQISVADGVRRSFNGQRNAQSQRSLQFSIIDLKDPRGTPKNKSSQAFEGLQGVSLK